MVRFDGRIWRTAIKCYVRTVSLFVENQEQSSGVTSSDYITPQQQQLSSIKPKRHPVQYERNMFRRPGKPRSNATQDRIRRRPDDDDDDDDNEPIPLAFVRQSQTQTKLSKTKRTVVRTNDVDLAQQQEQDIPDQAKQKKRRRTAGLTLRDTGGSGRAIHKPACGTPPSSSSMYGSDAMAQLKSEQKYQKKKAKPQNQELDTDTFQNELDLIAGDEMSPEQSAIYNLDPQEIRGFPDGFQGHYEAGQSSPTTLPPYPPPKQVLASRSEAASATTTITPKNTSLAEMRRQVDKALGRLQAHQAELMRVQERRRHQVGQIEEELQRYEHDLHISGKAHEYFQTLRYRLASWVGALRDLNTKVIPLQNALYELEAEVSAVNRWKEWEDDIASVLNEHGYLECVLGRQPDANVVDSLNTSQVVDEFGRNVQSQFAMQRDKRFQRRQRIGEQREQAPRGDESDAFLSDNEQELFRERHVALKEALEVAVADLDEEYTKLQVLVDDFEKWHAAYPDEYQQCFTSLSLADLASVLVRVELCSLNDPWNESRGYNEGKWTAVIRAAKRSGALDDSGLERLIEKTVLPSVCNLLENSGVNLSSKRQMESMGHFVSNVKHLLRPESNVLNILLEKLAAYVQKFLKEVAVPIPKQIATTVMQTEEVNLREAVHGAVTGQMHRMKKIVMNLLVSWAPILQDSIEFTDAVLDFVGTKFIFLLSSLKDFEQPRFSATPTDAFFEVWEALQRTKWLDQPEFMLSAAPIRAAASVYGVGGKSVGAEED